MAFSAPLIGNATLEETLLDVSDYYEDTWANAINDAQDALDLLGGGVLYFPNDEYDLAVGDVTMSSNTEWRGETGATITSSEEAVYGFIVVVADKENVTINNIIFDQRGDSALLPTKDPYKPCGAIWFDACENYYVHDCTFYCYGIVPVFGDDWAAESVTCFNATFKDNTMVWTKKADGFYDVSIGHFQARRVECSGNTISSVATAFTADIPRTGFEINSPDGYCTSNTFTRTEVGMLNVPWMSNSLNYDSEFVGSFLINLNTMVNCGAIGIELWMGIGGNGRDLKNITIEYNTIGMYRENSDYSKPTAGIRFYHGGAYTAEGYDIEIHHNDINFTYDTGFLANLTAVQSNYHQSQYGEYTGVFNLNVANNLHDINIHDNTADEFPYCFLNLYRIDGAGANIHEDVNFYDNSSTDCHYATPYYVAETNETESSNCFTVGQCDSCEITDNAMDNTNIAIVGEKEELAGVTNLTYTGNTFGP